MTSTDASRFLVGRELRRRAKPALAAGLVLGLCAGVALAALVGARRTATAYDRLVEVSDFPDVFVQLLEPVEGVSDQIRRLAAVDRAVESTFLIGRRGSVRKQELVPVASGSTPYAELQIAEGRPARPDAVDEIVISAAFSEFLGLDVGDVLDFHALASGEMHDLFRDRYAGVASGPRLDLRVVGIVHVPTDVVLEEFPTIIGTSAFHERHGRHGARLSGLWIHLRAGTTVTELERQIAELDLDPPSADRLNALDVMSLDAERGTVDDATRVVTVGLGAIGVIGPLVTLVLLLQIVSRTLEAQRADLQILREIGLERRSRSLVAAAPAVIVGSVSAAVACVFALLTSYLTPVGVAEELEPSPGIAIHWLGLGSGGLAVITTTLTIWLVRARRFASAGPGTGSAGLRRPPLRGIRRTAGVTVSVAAGLALGDGRPTASRRLVAVGTSLGVAGAVAAVLFGASLDRLAVHPARWGWVGDHAIELPEPVHAETLAVLDTAPEVDAYAELTGATVTIEDRSVNATHFAARRGVMAPTILAGRAPAVSGEIALGPTLLADLDVQIGDVVDVDAGRGSFKARIVGSVVTLGLSEISKHTAGAVVASDLDGTTAFHTALVRFAPGVDPQTAAERLYPDLEYGSPSRPTDVTNLAAVRGLPRALAGLLAATAAIGVVHGVRTMTSRHHRDLAVVRALGVTRRHVIAMVMVAGVTSTSLAVGIGAPLGFIAAQNIWVVVASSTDLATDLAMAPMVLLAVPGAVVLAALAGAFHARNVTRRRWSSTLRPD